MASRLTHWMRCNLSMQGYDALSEDERRRLGFALSCRRRFAMGAAGFEPATSRV
jgi:hypothetical protein